MTTVLAPFRTTTRWSAWASATAWPSRSAWTSAIGAAGQAGELAGVGREHDRAAEVGRGVSVWPARAFRASASRTVGTLTSSIDPVDQLADLVRLAQSGPDREHVGRVRAAARAPCGRARTGAGRRRRSRADRSCTTARSWRRSAGPRPGRRPGPARRPSARPRRRPGRRRRPCRGCRRPRARVPYIPLWLSAGRFGRASGSVVDSFKRHERAPPQRIRGRLHRGPAAAEPGLARPPRDQARDVAAVEARRRCSRPPRSRRSC